MNKTNLYPIVICLVCLVVLTAGAGCSRSDTQPQTVSLEQLPVTLEQSFAKAGEETKAQVKATADLVRQREYVRAFQSLQSLSARSGLTREQSRTVAGALLTMNNTLQNAQSQGDAVAAATLQKHRREK
jgi:hypothetical protein